MGARAKKQGGLGSDETETPPDFFQHVASVYRFKHDVCASDDNKLLPSFFTRTQNALAVEWPRVACFMNPPYSRGNLPLFTARARQQVRHGSAPLVGCLIPADTGTEWWREHVLGGDELSGSSFVGRGMLGWPQLMLSFDSLYTSIHFVPGRLHFWLNGKPTKFRSPFPSAFVVHAKPYAL